MSNQIPKKIAEVIEAGTTLFTAQCYELYEIPAFGSLVRTGNIYGIVADATTSSLEPGRRPIARGRDEATEADIYKENPQLASLLRSEFGTVVAGYSDDNKIYHYLPPQPARIHGFVYQCEPEEIREFSRSFGFLQILSCAVTGVPSDEVIAATLRYMSRAHEDPRAFLVAAGKELANLLSSDFIRLKSVLGRLQ